MQAAGYDVTMQTYKFTYYAFVGTPTLSEGSPTAHDFTLVDDWNPGQSNGDGDRATLQPAGGIVIPPTPTLELDERLHGGRLQRLRRRARSR